MTQFDEDQRDRPRSILSPILDRLLVSQGSEEQVWREWIFFAIFLSGILVGSVSYVSSVRFALRMGLWGNIIIYTIAYAWAILITFVRRLPFRFRAASGLFLLYVLGLLTFLEVGPAGSGRVWLFAFSVGASLLLGLWAGLFALALNGLTLILVNGLVRAGYLLWPTPTHDPSAWVVTSLTFFFLNTVFTVSLAVLVRGLEKSLGKERQLITQLQQEIVERKRIEKALRDSEERYREILQTIQDGYYEVDLAGNLTFFNDSLCRIIGYPRSELMGMNNRAYMDKENSRTVYQVFNHVYRTGEPRKGVDWELIRKDGTRRYVEVSVSLITDGDGEPVGFRGIARDVTQRKRVEEALRTQTQIQERLLETARSLTESLDVKEVLTRIARQAREILNAQGCVIYLLEEEGDILHPVVTVDPFCEEDLATPLRVESSFTGQAIKTGHSMIFNDAVMNPGGWWAPGPFEEGEQFIAAPFIVDEQVLGAMCLNREEPDFSEEDRALAETFAVYAAMALKNAQTHHKLSDAMARLKEADVLKNEFIQNVSHELRSPLGLIQGYAELLAEGALGELSPRQKQPAQIIARRARMLRDMVEDLALILLAEARHVELEQVSLDELVRSTVKDFRVAADQAGVRLTVEVPPHLPPVQGEINQLRRVLDNLISNAVKFTPEGGRITVKAQKQVDTILLEVSDTGIGIPSDQQERIFERFYRVGGKDRRRYGGIGLGLALVKEIIEAHGGSVTVESQVGEGSTFSLTLPLSE